MTGLSTGIACPASLIVGAVADASQGNVMVTVVEGVDFPNSRFTPAIIPSVLGLGDNVITGTLPGSSTIPDMDVFRVDNPDGLTISAIPEPAVAVFLGAAGLALLVGRARRPEPGPG